MVFTNTKTDANNRLVHPLGHGPGRCHGESVDARGYPDRLERPPLCSWIIAMDHGVGHVRKITEAASEQELIQQGDCLPRALPTLRRYVQEHKLCFPRTTSENGRSKSKRA